MSISATKVVESKVYTYGVKVLNYIKNMKYFLNNEFDL